MADHFSFITITSSTNKSKLWIAQDLSNSQTSGESKIEHNSIDSYKLLQNRIDSKIGILETRHSMVCLGGNQQSS